MSNIELKVMAGPTERSILANSNEFYEDEDHALRINPSAFGEILVGFSAGVFETPPTLIDNGDGTITLGSFQCLLFDNDDKYGELQKFFIPGFTYSLVDNTTNYVVVNYNSGFPVVQIIQNVSLINESSVVPVYTIVRTGVILHTIPWDSLANGLSNKLNARFVKTRRFERESGLSLTCPLRVVTVSPGVAWYGGNAVSLEQCVSNVDSFRLYYHSAGVWTSNTATEVNITQYDDGNDLQPLTANRYAVNWIFRGVENQKHLYAVLGVGDYTLAQAQAAQVPALPDAITSHAILVGKIIIQQGAVSPFSVQSAFDTTFTGGAVQTASGVSEVNYGDVQTAINSLLPLTSDVNIFVCRPAESGYVSGDFSTIGDALDYARRFTMGRGKYIYINVRDNHVLNYQVIIENCDFSYVVLQRVGASMTSFPVNPSGFVAGDGGYALFYISSGKSPRFNMLFNLQKSIYNAQGYRGLTCSEGGFVIGTVGAGFTNCNGNGITILPGGTISWTGVRSTNSGGSGVSILGGTAVFTDGIFTGSAGYAIVAYGASRVTANACTATTVTASVPTFLSQQLSSLNVRSAVTTGTSSTTPFQVLSGGLMNAEGTTGATNVTVNTVNAAGIIFR